MARSSNLVRSNMNKSNCEQIEEVRNNILTDRKFGEMIGKHKNNPLGDVDEANQTDQPKIGKYEDNPLVWLFRGNNRCPGYHEISLIGMWVKTLQDVNGLVKVRKEMTKHEKDYQHARLQLELAATIHRNDTCNVIELEPHVRSGHADILANINGADVYIEVKHRSEFERFWRYQDITLIISEMARILKLEKISVDISIRHVIPSKDYIYGALVKVGRKLKNGILPFSIEEKEFTIDVKEGWESSAFDFMKYEYENGEFVLSGYTVNITHELCNIIKDKSDQLPKDSPGLFVIKVPTYTHNKIEYDYIKKKIHEIFENHRDRCNNILGLALIPNRHVLSTDDPIFENVENPYCTTKYGVSYTDVVEVLKGNWEVDSTCFERYRSLFDSFYGKPRPQSPPHWQEEARKIAEEILEEV